MVVWVTRIGINYDVRTSPGKALGLETSSGSALLQEQVLCQSEVDDGMAASDGVADSAAVLVSDLSRAGDRVGERAP